MEMASWQEVNVTDRIDKKEKKVDKDSVADVEIDIHHSTYPGYASTPRKTSNHPSVHQVQPTSRLPPVLSTRHAAHFTLPNLYWCSFVSNSI